MLLLKLSFRNVFRNLRRSILTASVIGIGLGAVIFTDAYILGMERNMIKSATDTFLGHGQIHQVGYPAAREVEKVVLKGPLLIQQIAQDKKVSGYTSRVQSIGMLSSASDVASILVSGIDPEKEAQMTPIQKAVKEGAYFSETGSREILIGQKLAKNLSVGLGDRLVLTLAQASTGELSQEMFRVSGIFRFGSNRIDESMALIKIGDAQRLLGIGQDFHELAVRFNEPNPSAETLAQFEKAYSKEGNEALGWRQLMPEFQAILDMMGYVTGATIVIVFGIVALSVMNCLFMAFFERIFEFAVLRAIGTRPYQMALMVTLEAAVLSALGVFMGLVIGGGFTGILAVWGIDYGGIEMQGVTMQESVFPVVNWKQFFLYPLFFFGFSVLVGLYPAIHTARLVPAKAMKAGQ
ncbi:MAG: hypothetical protein A2508_06640 [Candidatus Lambdaproteobacteria bacterium RIFOXYD12_FULL_49_8]|uniref:ABC3 transporter permease protein domain-containing protein n=1 Tax=Candidatus Lambdaproteobacteria bacterium RIFOXYD2_FULL_50_16 TaxID=1817772 RepID=A0A1F6GDC4_9PROT|nr:MAG: hypothetical protein A2527_12315 [Candidatus Lambdaproteobacteria bacterium RIFOXYD2_FULL_50_16]OGG98244.1 MAG: hypothetical protein A2508_06640 [Candidatus Lambdaproteobacteria bacterium RIFOXYD12_FULL_49_8]